jgi:hypothetical protein
MELINLSLEYYNDSQHDLFQCFPNSTQLNNLVNNGLTITKDEFLANMMFTEQMDRDGFRTYVDLQGRIESRFGDINDFLSFDNDSVQSKMNGTQMMQSGFTERIGVSLGLCVMNKIHGFTAADWEKIPETRGRSGNPTFDFEIQIASTGANFIQAENKGAIIVDNSVQNGSIPVHYSSIKSKKKYVRQQEIIRNIPIHQNLFYGTIGALDTRPGSIAKVWLVDPPAYEIEMEPSKYKLLSRLKYYLAEFRNIGVKGYILNALEKRIIEIEKTSDYYEFNNVPLKSIYVPKIRQYLDGKMFAAVDNNEAFGRIFIIESKERYFPYLIAFPKAIMRIIILQNFDNIMNYEYNPDFINDKVQVLMRLGSKDIDVNKLPNDIKFVLNERKKFYEAVYFGQVSHSADGRIFGLLGNEI